MNWKEALPDYEFKRNLQRSYTADTILMRHLPTGEDRVVKVSFLSNLDAQRRALFEQEANLLMQLQSHQNIIRLIDFHMLPEYFVLITEYANSGDLHQLIDYHRQRGESMKNAVVYSITAYIANALAFLKKQHIIHRDIKPANIFLHKNERKQLIVKVGDFGISKLLGQSEVASTLVGTLEYVSPEFLSEMPYSYESDAWALGVVLYEMVAQKSPFYAQSNSEIMTKIKTGDYAAFKTGIGEIDTWLSRLLVVDPTRRMRVEEIPKSPTSINVLRMLGIQTEQ